MGACIYVVIEDGIDGVEFILVELLVVHDIVCVRLDRQFIGRNFTFSSVES